LKLRISKCAGVSLVAGAAAALLAAPGSAAAAGVGSVRSWGAGTMSPGQSKSYTWNNANSDLYQVNTGAVRADDPSAPCQLEVTRQWYRRAAGAARQFLLTIKNIDSASCDATVYLAPVTADRSGATGVINPGSSKAWHWNNANVEDFVYISGVTPSDPGSGTCQLETTWKNRANAGGEQEYVWTVRNTGSVACEGQWRLGWLPADDRTRFPADDEPTSPGGRRWLTSPEHDPFRAYFFNLVPAAPATGSCEWGPMFLRMSGDPAGPTEGAQTEVGYTNVGSQACVLSGVNKAYVR
jgi:hypothetical protein